MNVLTIQQALSTSQTNQQHWAQAASNFKRDADSLAGEAVRSYGLSTAECIQAGRSNDLYYSGQKRQALQRADYALYMSEEWQKIENRIVNDAMITAVKAESLVQKGYLL